ncbi:MAG: N-acetylmuramic acid 6-phosphate etherase, partial [Spirochaetales bacterium]|nr:N-acetylmuramic acid 6-phosphate etherase [Spirochaetales bacterium]
TPVNRKLVERSKRLIRQATGCSKEEAEAAFLASGRRPKLAILMVMLSIGRDEAEKLLAQGEGRIADALRLYRNEQ